MCVWVSEWIFFGFVLGGLSSRVPVEVSSAVQLVVCMGECTDIFWIRLARCLLRCRLLFKWWCMGECTQVFGFVLGRNRFFQCNDAKILFSESKVAKHEVHSVIKKSQLAFMSTIDLYVCLGTLYYILYSYLFLVQKYPCKNRIYID